VVSEYGEGVAEDFVGQSVALWRRRRGMTQQVLAGLCGVSQAYVSMLERGQRAIDKRSTVIALAEALRVSVTELTGQPYPPVDPNHERATAAVPAVRAALVRLAYGDIPVPGRSLEASVVAADDLSLARRRCDYTAAVDAAPSLVLELAAHAAGSDGGRAQNLLAIVLHDVAFVLKHLGYADLAYQAGGLCAGQAARLEEPALVGLANYTRLQVLAPESRQLGQQLARRAIDELDGHLGSDAARQIYGQLHLTAGWADALAGHVDDAEAHLDEAEQIAAGLGEPVEGGFGRTNFGPTNVAQWRASIAIETGNPGRAVVLADKVNPHHIAAPSRAAAFHIDRGNALAQVRRDRDALVAFLTAERVAPQRVRLNSTVRDSVGVMLRRARRSAGGADLRAVASRFRLT
jgi:transcriptional regulator with XRE-family HTH domain